MGIKLSDSNFDEQDFQVLQTKAAGSNVTTMAETEQQVIDKFEGLNNIELSGISGSYSYSYSQEEKDNDKDYDSSWRPESDIDTSLSFSNIQLINNPQWIISNEGEIIHDTSKDTKDEEYYYRVVTYQYQINYKHFQESSITVSGNIWTNNARVIYHRKTCSYSYEEPIEDGYEGSDSISIILEQKVTWHWTEEIEIEDPVEATTFGAFPSGISADYCILVTKSDSNFVETYTTAEKISELNDIANDYAERMATIDDPTINWEDKKYFSLYEKKPCIYLTKNSVDNSEELQDDWKYLYDEETLALENGLAKCKIGGSEKLEDCYRVFLMGKAQLCGIDLNQFITDTQGGSTELSGYNFPNGYYFIIGRQLYLFLLTDLSPIEWGGNTPEEKPPVEITFLDYSSLIKDETTYILTSRKEDISDEKYYLYKGHKIKEVFSDGMEKTDIILNPSDLREVTVSDSIKTIGYFSAIANPTKGFLFPKYLEYLGPFTYNPSGSTSLFIYGGYLKEIAESAFGEGTANAVIYLADNEEIDYLKSLEDLSSTTIREGYLGTTNSLKSIGSYAFKNLKFSIVNLTASSQLDFVGTEALATATACKKFHFIAAQLSQRGTNSKQDLIYLPDECLDKINDQTSPEDVLTIHQDNSSYNNDTKHRTLGTALSGYNIYIHSNNDIKTLYDFIGENT